MSWVPAERAALAETFRTADPAAPTLCEGWTATHLLAHLVLRENNPAGNIADRIARRTPGHEKHLGRLAATAGDQDGYQALVDRFAAGAPRWSPMNWASEQLNLFEFVVHHEDLRRGDGTLPPPRDLPAGEQDALFSRASLIARLAYRRLPVEVRLTGPDGTTTNAGRGGRRVELTGGPIELALYVSGRQSAADVHLDGDRDAMTTFLTATNHTPKI